MCVLRLGRRCQNTCFGQPYVGDGSQQHRATPRNRRRQNGETHAVGLRRAQNDETYPHGQACRASRRNAHRQRNFPRLHYAVDPRALAFPHRERPSTPRRRYDCLYVRRRAQQHRAKFPGIRFLYVAIDAFQRKNRRHGLWQSDDLWGCRKIPGVKHSSPVY